MQPNTSNSPIVCPLFVLCLHRYANLFLHPVKEEDAPGYYEIVLRLVKSHDYQMTCLFT